MRSRRTPGSGASDPSSEASSSTPSPDQSGRGRLIVICGPSGVGKSSVIDRVEQRRPVHFSVSLTTRGARPGERDGVDYRFVDRDEFERSIHNGDLIEWAEYDQHLYGTPRQAVEPHLSGGEDVLLDIEVQGAAQVKTAYSEAILIFIAPPSMEELERRLRRRGDTDDADIGRRLRIARRQLEDAEALFDHVVVNDDLSRAVEEVLGILHPTRRNSL
ncbi:MAG: guanylate kinase [Acidimicrobiia bacterium]